MQDDRPAIFIHKGKAKHTASSQDRRGAPGQRGGARPKPPFVTARPASDPERSCAPSADFPVLPRHLGSGPLFVKRRPSRALISATPEGSDKSCAVAAAVVATSVDEAADSAVSRSEVAPPFIRRAPSTPAAVDAVLAPSGPQSGSRASDGSSEGIPTAAPPPTSIFVKRKKPDQPPAAEPAAPSSDQSRASAVESTGPAPLLVVKRKLPSSTSASKVESVSTSHLDSKIRQASSSDGSKIIFRQTEVPRLMPQQEEHAGEQEDASWHSTPDSPVPLRLQDRGPLTPSATSRFELWDTYSDLGRLSSEEANESSEDEMLPFFESSRQIGDAKEPPPVVGRFLSQDIEPDQTLARNQRPYPSSQPDPGSPRNPNVSPYREAYLSLNSTVMHWLRELLGTMAPRLFEEATRLHRQAESAPDPDALEDGYRDCLKVVMLSPPAQCALLRRVLQCLDKSGTISEIKLYRMSNDVLEAVIHWVDGPRTPPFYLQLCDTVFRICGIFPTPLKGLSFRFRDEYAHTRFQIFLDGARRFLKDDEYTRFKMGSGILTDSTARYYEKLGFSTPVPANRELGGWFFEFYFKGVQACGKGVPPNPLVPEEIPPDVKDFVPQFTTVRKLPNLLISTSQLTASNLTAMEETLKDIPLTFPPTPDEEARDCYDYTWPRNLVFAICPSGMSELPPYLRHYLVLPGHYEIQDITTSANEDLAAGPVLIGFAQSLTSNNQQASDLTENPQNLQFDRPSPHSQGSIYSQTPVSSQQPRDPGPEAKSHPDPICASLERESKYKRYYYVLHELFQGGSGSSIDLLAAELASYLSGEHRIAIIVEDSPRHAEVVGCLVHSVILRMSAHLRTTEQSRIEAFHRPVEVGEGIYTPSVLFTLIEPEGSTFSEHMEIPPLPTSNPICRRAYMIRYTLINDAGARAENPDGVASLLAQTDALSPEVKRSVEALAREAPLDRDHAPVELNWALSQILIWGGYNWQLGTRRV